jgi:CubicO group peptidase (beta-lactamase class C family)
VTGTNTEVFMPAPVRPAAILFLGIQLTAPATIAQTRAPDFRGLERVVTNELKETSTPGAAVAIVSGDRIIYAKGFGISNVETGAPVTPDMLFLLASTTKMLTAAALVSVAEERRLSLDQPIGDYVKGLGPRLSRVTMTQLLSHWLNN